MCNCNYYCVIDEKNEVKCNKTVDRLNGEFDHTQKNVICYA